MLHYVLIFIFLKFNAATTEALDGISSSYCYKKNNENRFRIGWTCDASTHKCVKSFMNNSTDSCLLSLRVCKLLCDTYGSVWPRPTKITRIKKKLISIESDKIAFKIDIPGNSNQLWNMLEELELYFLNVVALPLKTVKPIANGCNLFVILKIKNESVLSFSYKTEESYSLSVHFSNDMNRVEAVIQGDNFFGVRHGIETLAQLLVFDEISNSILIPEDVIIVDEPVYQHRGILLDTARSFYSVKSIKKMLDAMAQNKLNTFHWHLSDSQSFPFQSKIYPQMTQYGAYSSSQVYTWTDINEILKYAKIRGIRIIPEFDAPSHVGEGWQYFEEQKSNNDSVILCFKAEPWKQYCVEPPCGILNPISERVYEILKNLYAEFNELFDADVFHMGGDEVSFYCWKKTSAIVDWIRKHNKNDDDTAYLELWSYFQTRALQQFDKSSKVESSRVIVWSSTLTESSNVTDYLRPERYIIQIWTAIHDKQIADLLEKGYDMIFSNYDALYFDCGFGAWIGEGNNWCSPYIGWQKVYMNDPRSTIRKKYAGKNESLIHKLEKQILGAEATLWSEQSDENTLDSRLWPRGCALAERLWSNPAEDWKFAEARLLTQRERMLTRGIAADLVEPPWCHQNEGLCY